MSHIAETYNNLGPRTALTGDLRLTRAPQFYRDSLRGTTYFVDTNNGDDDRIGKSWTSAFLTMSKAFEVLDSGDRIYFVGNVTEHVTTPLARAQNVSIIGATTRPRHADTHPGGGELSGATWKDTGTATPLITLRNSGWRFENILFAANASSYAVTLERNAIETAAGEFDASHAAFVGCRFASGGGLNDTGGCFNVLVAGNVFGAVNPAILGVGNIGIGQLQWHILDNHFNNFTNGVKIAGHECVVRGNFFTDGGTPNTTYVLNMSNGAGRDNFVVENWFQGTTANFNSPDVVGNATDVWYNHALDTQAAGVNGVYEVGNPA